MRYIITVLLILPVFALHGVSYAAAEADSILVKCAPATAENAEGDFVAGEIVVVFEDDVTPAAIETLVEGAGGTITETSALNPSRVVVAVPDGREDEFIDAYLRLDGVRTAEKNYVFTTQPESKPTEYKTTVGD